MLSELDLHVTNRCTTSCAYCCFSSNRKELPELTTVELKRIIDDAKYLGCTHVHFTGGEPLIRDDIYELIGYASQSGLEMRLQTNGMLLTKDSAFKLIQSGLTSIMISLDSDRPIEHDKLRGDGTWAAAVDAIKNALEVGLSVRVNSVLTKENWSRIHKTILFVQTIGVKKYSAFYFSPIGCGALLKKVWIEPNQYLEYWKKLKAELQLDPTISEMDIVIEKGYADWGEATSIEIKEFTGCGGGCNHTYNSRDYLIVRCDGNVYPCIMSIDHEALGNVKKNSLKEIHSNSALWNKMLPPHDTFCDNCEHYELCGEGCRYYPQNQDGHDIRCVKNKIVPLCPIMKYNTRNDALGGSSEDVMD